MADEVGNTCVAKNVTDNIEIPTASLGYTIRLSRV